MEFCFISYNKNKAFSDFFECQAQILNLNHLQILINRAKLNLLYQTWGWVFRVVYQVRKVPGGHPLHIMSFCY